MHSESPQSSLPALYRFSVDQYHRMIDAGILTTDDRAELLEGWIVLKARQTPPHAYTVQHSRDTIRAALAHGWCVRMRFPVTLDESEPEPDLAIVRGTHRDYTTRHPNAAEISALAEVADTSLEQDRGWKAGIYAAACVPVYWIINLVNEQIEVYEDPTGPDPMPAYRRQQTYHRGQSVPLVLDASQAAMIPVDELLP